MRTLGPEVTSPVRHVVPTEVAPALTCLRSVVEGPGSLLGSKRGPLEFGHRRDSRWFPLLRALAGPGGLRRVHPSRSCGSLVGRVSTGPAATQLSSGAQTLSLQRLLPAVPREGPLMSRDYIS